MSLNPADLPVDVVGELFTYVHWTDWNSFLRCCKSWNIAARKRIDLRKWKGGAKGAAHKALQEMLKRNNLEAALFLVNTEYYKRYPHQGLWSASSQGCLPVVEFFLSSESAKKISAAQVYAILRTAAGAGHVDIVRLLLKDSRANPTMDNYSCITTAMYMQHYDVVQVLLEDKRVNLQSHTVKRILQNLPQDQQQQFSCIAA